MLSMASERKELRGIIFKTLSRKFKFKFKNVDDWSRWWTIIYVQGVNENGICAKVACINAIPCVSLGVPDGSSICDEICQLEVVGKLHAAGVSVYSHPEIKSQKNSRGCVGYRPDIGGTEAGAKCIAKVLGYSSLVWGCNEDGARYNVRTH